MALRTPTPLLYFLFSVIKTVALAG